MRRNRTQLRLLLIGLSTLLTACALRSTVAVDAAEPEPMSAQQAQQLSQSLNLDGDIYYQLLVGELAAQNELYDQAALAYERLLGLASTQALDEQSRYVLTRRAWELGRQANHVELAAEAAQQWQHMEAGLRPRLARVIAVLNASEAKQLQTMQSVLQLAPKERTGFALLMARQFEENDKADDLLTLLHGWLKHNPYDADMLLTAALVAETNGQHWQSYSWWQRRAAVVADAAMRWEAKAHAAVNLRVIGQPQEAAQILARLHNERPDEHWVALEYVRSLLQVDRAQQAIPVLKRLMQGGKATPVVLYSAGFAYFLEQDYKTAADYFERALEKGYDQHDAGYWAGRSYQEAGLLDLAVAQYQALPSGERWVDAQINVGEILAQQQRWQDMRDHFEMLRHRRAGQTTDWYLAEAEIWANNKKLSQAFEVINQGLEEAPESVELLYLRANFLVEANQIEAATQQLEFLIKHHPEDPDVLDAYDYLLIDQMGRVSEGLRLVEKALVLKPESAPIMDSYGWGLLRQGDVSQAVTWLSRAWEATKDHEIGAHLGEALWLNQQHAMALQIWREAENLPRGRRPDKVEAAKRRLGVAQ